MNKDISNYDIQFSCDSKLVEQLVIEWLKINKYNLRTKQGIEAYYSNSIMTSNIGIQYNIIDNVLNIKAWTLGYGKKRYPLDTKWVNSIPAQNLKDKLSSLFNQLKKLDSNNTVQEDTEFIDNTNNTESLENKEINSQTLNIENFTQSFEEEKNKKNETLCEIGFWMSIVALLTSFLGIVYNIFIYIFIFYAGSLGLKTKKCSKAKATIVMGIVSVIIFIFNLILTILLNY